MSTFHEAPNAREILYAFANVQRQQEGVRKAKSGLSGDLMALAIPYQCKGDKEYGQCINEEERESRALSLANMFAEYLKPVEDDFKKRENAKLPGAWTQAKSDIKAAIKYQLEIDSFGSFDELKKAKLAAAKAAKGEPETGGEESGEGGESDGPEVAGTIETDSPIIAELLGQFSHLVGEALKNGDVKTVQDTLEDACLRLALSEEESTIEHEQAQITNAA